MPVKCWIDEEARRLGCHRFRSHQFRSLNWAPPTASSSAARGLESSRVVGRFGFGSSKAGDRVGGFGSRRSDASWVLGCFGSRRSTTRREAACSLLIEDARGSRGHGHFCGSVPRAARGKLIAVHVRRTSRGAHPSWCDGLTDQVLQIRGIAAGRDGAKQSKVLKGPA